MLTKSDLTQIRSVVREEIQEQTPKITRRIVQEELAPVKGAIETMKSDIVKIRRDIKVIVAFFDREYLELRKRVERIEEHLGLVPSPV